MNYIINRTISLYVLNSICIQYACDFRMVEITLELLHIVPYKRGQVMSTVLLGIGLPGSGKTTVLKLLADKLGCRYIDVDQMRRDLGISLSELLDGGSEVLKLRAQVRESIREALGEGLDVIIDDYNSDHIERRVLIAFCRRNGARKVRGIWFVPPREICLHRNARRHNPNDVVPRDIVLSIDEQILAHKPSREEGFDQLDIINTAARRNKLQASK